MQQLQSADELLEQGVLALYRQWPHLPRRTTIPALDRLRTAFAAELESMLAAPDQEQFQHAAARFAAETLRLPLVQSVAGAELEKLAAVQPRAAGVRSFAFIKVAVLTPERLHALIELLRAADPPAYAVQRWHYVVSETAMAWDDLRPAVESVLDRLAPEAKQQVAAIDAALSTALDAAPRPTPAIYEEALKQLEAIPGIVAALSDRFLNWKEAQRVIRRSAEFVTSASWNAESAAIPKGADSAWEEMATAEAPTGAEPLEAAGPPEEATPTPIQVNFHTDVKFPTTVQRWQVTWLIVRLRLEKPETTAAAGVVPVEFTQVGDEPPPPEYVTVRVLAPDFEEETRCWERTITVRVDQDSDPAVFLLKGSDLGKKRIAIDFYHKGRLVGNVAFTTEVTQQATSSASVVIARSEEDAPEFARFERNPPPPADLHLRVVKKAQANTLAFWLDSPLPEASYRWELMGEIPLTAQDPLTFLAQELAPLNEMVQLLTADLSPDEVAEAEQRLALLAEGLFEQLLPERFRHEYFTRILPLRDAGVIRSLLITSDEPWIPWELLKPYHYDVSTAQEYTDDFWATCFVFSRWLAGRGPVAHVAVDTAALVLPDVGLPAVAAEQDFFATLAAQRMVKLTGPSQLRKEVLDLFALGGYQVLHIATHGQFDAADADRSVIELADEMLRPADLRGSLLRGIRRSMPLVFLNACDGGRANFGLTGLGGWAEKLFKEANAAAFVGALWEVHDELAVEFSRQFYSRLSEGDTLGQAVQAARAHVRQLDPLNPTWLAYTLYGDPNAVVRIGTPES